MRAGDAAKRSFVIIVLATLGMGAKCPIEDGDHQAGGGGGHYDAGLPADAGPDRAANDGAQADVGADGQAGAGACSASSPRDLWTPESLTSPVFGVSSLSPTDAWRNTITSVDHWDGSKWKTVLTGDSFYSPIQAFAKNDVWVNGASALWHWNGKVWAQSVPPRSGDPIWGTSSRDIWLWKELGEPSVFHWDGTAWSDRTPTTDASGSPLVDISGIWGAASDDVWAAGAIDKTYYHISALAHWNGRDWQTVELLPYDSLSGAVWGTAANDIWAHSGVSGFWHYDGATWSNTYQGGTSGGGAFWGSCASDTWAAFGTLSHFDGQHWTNVYIGIGDGQVVGAVGGSGPDDVWLGGGDGETGRMLHRHPGNSKPVCGNFRVDPGEQCDPPGTTVCDAHCQVIPFCGNGFIDPGEACDPPQSDSRFPICTGQCQFPICGNGVIEPGEDCDPPDGVLCNLACGRIIPRCGNGVVDPGEQCEPPGSTTYINNLPLLCDSTCQRPRCGNGTIDSGEACDPPGTRSSGGLLCDATCQLPLCGNGVVDPGEQCDPPVSSGTQRCDDKCQISLCGNGVVDPGEECDYGEGEFCQACKQTCLGKCFIATTTGPNGPDVCKPLSGADQVNCYTLLNCMAFNWGYCAYHPSPLGCYCSDATCSLGANGQCSRQFEAVAESTDPVEVMRQLNDPTSTLYGVGKLASQYVNFVGACLNSCRALGQ